MVVSYENMLVEWYVLKHFSVRVLSVNNDGIIEQLKGMLTYIARHLVDNYSAGTHKCPYELLFITF